MILDIIDTSAFVKKNELFTKNNLCCSSKVMMDPVVEFLDPVVEFLDPVVELVAGVR